MTSRLRRSRRIMRSSTRVMSSHEATEPRSHGGKEMRIALAARIRQLCAASGRLSSPSWLRGFVASSLLLTGCAHVPNQFVEDSPASSGALESETVHDLY